MLTRTEKTAALELGTGIRVINAILDERPNGDIILRGSIDPMTLHNLKTDDYQREVLAGSGTGGHRKSKLRKGVEAGVTLPEIELGMRGSNVSFSGKTAVLNDSVYIIDGLQRVSTVLMYMADLQAAGKSLKEGSATNPLAATIHFNTTKEWEKQRFADLNQLRTPVSPNVMLRNMRDQHPALLTLYGLTHNEPGFAMYRRVCWNQRMNKSELITAASMVRAAKALHIAVHDRLANTGKGPSQGGDASVLKSPPMLDRVAKEIGLANFRENLRNFFELIDSCYGIRNVEFGQLQAHLRTNFMMTLGRFIANNPSLWSEDGKRFFVDSKTRQRFSSFPINDPEIRRLCSAGTMAMPSLYRHLLDHMNKGMKKHKLQ